MNKSAIKNFAVRARTQLIEAVSERVRQIEAALAQKGSGAVPEERFRLILEKMAESPARESFYEAQAYTWFNRLCALRYLEVNDYLPGHVRVFTDQNNAFNPQIISEALFLDLPQAPLNFSAVSQMSAANNYEQLFEYLLLRECANLNAALPGLFAPAGHYSELTLPGRLLTKGSFLHHLVSDIPEQDWHNSVEILGWLYQYYNTDPKEAIFASLKKGQKIAKEAIPAATQLFTPDWIVRYLVENSLGHYWQRLHPHRPRPAEWLYYNGEDVSSEAASSNELPPLNALQELRCFDPCMGSGHVLIYMFDVLMKLYTSCGYTSSQAAHNIIKYNLFGLDIDERAAQLAHFAVMMKARQCDCDFFTRHLKPQVYAFRETASLDEASIRYFCRDSLTERTALQPLFAAMANAKEFGSLIELETLDWSKLQSRLSELKLEAAANSEAALAYAQFQPFLAAAQLLSQSYQVTVTNPPYMGYRRMGLKLIQYVTAHYHDHRSDLFSAFVMRCRKFTQPHGYIGLLTPLVWMFLQSYMPLRQEIIKHCAVNTLIQFEYSAFEEATVPICAFVLQNCPSPSKGRYFRLSDYRGGMEVQRQKYLEALNHPECGYYYEHQATQFTQVPGWPLAFWLSDNFLASFAHPKLGETVTLKHGLTTGCNDTFLRRWYEVDINKIYWQAASRAEALASQKKWFPYNKGGKYRKWYGNEDYLINWENDGAEVRQHRGANGCIRSSCPNKAYYFRECVTWSLITSGKTSFRVRAAGSLFDVAGPCLYADQDSLYYLALGNSNYAEAVLQVLSPTLNCQLGDLAKLPLIISDQHRHIIERLAQENIAMCRSDWDEQEISKDFLSHPLVLPVASLAEAYQIRQLRCQERFNKLKANEEALNRIFAEIYGLEDELSWAIPDKDVSVSLAEPGREIRSLISYAVGCMFGRYALSSPGLKYAGGAWNVHNYPTFPPCCDNIIPLSYEASSPGDLYGRLVSFIEQLYGQNSLEENLQFMAQALGSSDEPRAALRRYLFSDFYNDHLQFYQKRPIYWQLDAGKRQSFKALVYMHRLRFDTPAAVRVNYVLEKKARLQATLERFDSEHSAASLKKSSAVVREAFRKERQALQEQFDEIAEYARNMQSWAEAKEVINLDDGVKYNYQLINNFAPEGGLLTPIK